MHDSQPSSALVSETGMFSVEKLESFSGSGGNEMLEAPANSSKGCRHEM